MNPCPSLRIFFKKRKNRSFQNLFLYLQWVTRLSLAPFSLLASVTSAKKREQQVKSKLQSSGGICLFHWVASTHPNGPHFCLRKTRRKETGMGREGKRQTQRDGLRNRGGDCGSSISSFFICIHLCTYSCFLIWYKIEKKKNGSFMCCILCQKLKEGGK